MYLKTLTKNTNIKLEKLKYDSRHKGLLINTTKKNRQHNIYLSQKSTNIYQNFSLTTQGPAVSSPPRRLQTQTVNQTIVQDGGKSRHVLRNQKGRERGMVGVEGGGVPSRGTCLIEVQEGRAPRLCLVCKLKDNLLLQFEVL